MKRIKRIISNINFREFKRYLFFSILLVVTLIAFNSLGFTQAKYESSTQVRISPSIAFFIVGVESQTGQIKLDGMVPSAQPYLYSFNVSNFGNGKRADVDLTYSIELITTTNMPLNFRIFKGNDMVTNEVDSDTVTTDSDGVYFRHLVINDVSTMTYSSDHTDTYTLWVEFPASYNTDAAAYAGVIDLVDIKIDAEQVV